MTISREPPRGETASGEATGGNFEWPSGRDYLADSKEFYVLILKPEPGKGVIVTSNVN